MLFTKSSGIVSASFFQMIPVRLEYLFCMERGLPGRRGFAGTMALEDFGISGRVTAAAAWKAALLYTEELGLSVGILLIIGGAFPTLVQQNPDILS
jgi:hypothetical protein